MTKGIWLTHHNSSHLPCWGLLSKHQKWGGSVYPAEVWRETSLARLQLPLVLSGTPGLAHCPAAPLCSPHHPLAPFPSPFMVPTLPFLRKHSPALS